MMKNNAVILAVIIVLMGIYVFLEMSLDLDPLKEPVTVEIRQGMSFDQAMDMLVIKNLTRDPSVFAALGRITGVDKSLIPGRYCFKGRLSPFDVFRKLKNGSITPWEVTILEGDTLENIKIKLLKDDLVSEEEFDRLVMDREFMNRMQIKAPSLEGYLFPDTYRIDKGLSAEKILALMVRRLREKYDEKMLARTSEIGLDERRILTLASIIEREAAVDSERPLISAVYHNRIKRRMYLQADPTAIYGVKSLSAGVRKADLKRKTPYNTYRIKGLPPGPIASPGLKSIKAALYPAEVPYLYFVSNNDGTHTFSRTMKEHIRAVRKYRKSRAKTRG
jgi:UPF0755 protein